MSEIKTHFISRFGKDGAIMNADYSQLEVIVLAHLSGDKVLTSDLLSGMDMHRVRAAELFGKTESEVTDTERTLAKALSFQLQYGAGPKSMAKNLGIEVSTAQQFVTNYYDRYPYVELFQRELLEKVRKNRATIPGHTPNGAPLQDSVIQSETGRKYRFICTDNPFFNKNGRTQLQKQETTFKPTEVKNYPVQGTATGDIVPMMLGKLYRAFIKEGVTYHAKLVNTVHDSIVLDVRNEACYDIGMLVKEVLEDAPNVYKQTFGVDFNIPLKVDVTWGPNWSDQLFSL